MHPGSWSPASASAPCHQLLLLLLLLPTCDEILGAAVVPQRLHQPLQRARAALLVRPEQARHKGAAQAPAGSGSTAGGGSAERPGRCWQAAAGPRCVAAAPPNQPPAARAGRVRRCARRHCAPLAACPCAAACIAGTYAAGCSPPATRSHLYCPAAACTAALHPPVVLWEVLAQEQEGGAVAAHADPELDHRLGAAVGRDLLVACGWARVGAGACGCVLRSP